MAEWRTPLCQTRNRSSSRVLHRGEGLPSLLAERRAVVPDAPSVPAPTPYTSDTLGAFLDVSPYPITAPQSCQARTDWVRWAPPKLDLPRLPVPDRPVLSSVADYQDTK